MNKLLSLRSLLSLLGQSHLWWNLHDEDAAEAAAEAGPGNVNLLSLLLSLLLNLLSQSHRWWNLHGEDAAEAAVEPGDVNLRLLRIQLRQ